MAGGSTTWSVMQKKTTDTSFLIYTSVPIFHAFIKANLCATVVDGWFSAIDFS
jgi:hypothetical protein